ncbi:acyl-CoA synthetase [Ideonella sp. DXS22W]|uniref:Acyl-CoA synthetase n=1 Tax=Pseudaquabacterium inlustre TaxID=2984192 RepID=A0ABU9CJR2_9BURK
MTSPTPLAQRAHPLDTVIGAQWPDLSTPEALAAFEAVPYAQRIAAHSTWQALRIGRDSAPDAPAIVFLPNARADDTPVVIPHRRFFAQVTQAANAFHALGVRPGGAVSLLLPLLPQAFTALFGAEAAGIANPVNPLLEPWQLVEILRAAGTQVLVTVGPLPGTDLWDKIAQVREQVPGLRAVVAVGGAGVATAQPGEAPAAVPASGGPVPIYDYDALLAAQPDDHLVSGREIAEGDVAAYFHTGGTTGTPKLVRHTHGNQVYQAWVIGLMLRVQRGGSMLFGLPLFHVGGALTQGLGILANGGHVVVLSPAGWRNPAAQREVWGLVRRWRPETFGGVPTVLAAALQMPHTADDLASLQRVSGGGSAIPVAVARSYSQDFGLPVLEVYGMTETASVHTISYVDRPVRLGAVGHAVPYSRVRIVKVDAEGRATADCAPGEIGVVAMAGPGVFGGYLSERHNAGAFAAPGWVNSGDLGRLDEDGYLWITGRAKDLVIRGGHNIDPLPIEEILYQHPAVALAAMVGQPDAYAGELPVAYVQPKPGQAVAPDELLAWVRERTPERAAVPVALHLLDALPLTGVGKVFKPALRWDAARRVAERDLADLACPGLQVVVDAHPVHGSLITVTVPGMPEDQRAVLTERIGQRLGPLTLRHAIEWR